MDDDESTFLVGSIMVLEAAFEAVCCGPAYCMSSIAEFAGSDEERATAAEHIWLVRKSLSKGLKLSGGALPSAVLPDNLSDRLSGSLSDTLPARSSD